ncbi:DNA-binding transcriptional activator of the SARP family [Actinomadura madurae]|uniref:DNA-binding transcriptional activator of the SARP family n=1 Tax=Actinomadura madurae TaxID=1993 RepID=A0A1I5NDA9_9ACTN|nr:tetratricopeptide repeat protein [Actinomadura madurae]SFP19211.1 DNA-binding transcriptional activator of the SARP family [Actinomadura madurae]
MEFRVIGPVELWINGRRRDLGTPKERCVLAVLLLSPRQPVPAETIIRRVWDDDPPAKARQGLHVYMTRLRRRLEDMEGAALISRQGSYLIDVEDESIDLFLFRRLRDQARAISESGDDEYALDHLRRAAELWRTEPLADLTGGWAERTRRNLEQELLAAAFLRIDLELQRGNHADLVRELYDLTERHPQHEWPVERLMLALYRCGRQAEALEVYRRTHDLFVAESGTDPGPGLKRIQQRILRGDPELLRVPGTQLSVDRRPHTLPHDARVFVGRDDELRQLMEMVPVGREPAASPPGSAVTVIALDGMAGAGKSILAVHLAHRLAAHFPDGQMFLSLHAHDARQPPVTPADALDTLLRMIGVPATRVPARLDERAALWRSELAGSRAIIVLDDAAGREQVEPLLPGSAGCLVIVTSRRRLTGLHDAWALPLEIMPVRDATALFTAIAGAGRTEPGTDVAAVVERCGRLPLAVSMAASRLRHRRAWDTRDLLDRLASGDRLDELRDEDREITTVFDDSYRALPPRQRDAFRAFALHPGPDLTAHSAAAALACPVREAERILEDLLDRHLITEPARGRYRFHDLVHDYARRLAHQTDPEEERRRTVHRILDFHLAAADHANRLMSHHPDGIPTDRPPGLPSPADEAEATEWFAAEHACLLNAAAEAHRIGSPARVARFARVLAGHLESRGHWDAAARLHTQAIEALQGLDDPPGTARALADLSLIRFRVGDYDTAMENAEKALEIHRSTGDRRGEADILGHMSLIHWHQSHFPEALAYCREALEIHRALGDRHGEAESLDHTAIFLEFTGDHREAERLRLEALAIFTDIDDPRGRTLALNNMGDLMIRMGDIDRAAEYYAQTAGAAELSRQHEAIALINMANVHRRTGSHEAALANYRAALAIAMELGDRRNQVETLIGIGATFHNTGRYGEALIHHERALTIARSISERYEETLALRHLGETLTASGRYPAAVDHLERAYALSTDIGVPYETARALESLGTALLHVQGSEAARHPWQEAIRLFTKLNLREAEDLRTRLQSLDHAAGT